TGNGVARHEFPVAWQYMGHLAPRAVAKYGFVGIPGGDADFFAATGVGDAAVAQIVLHRFANLRAMALDKALAVHRALVFAVGSSVDKVGHGVDSGSFDVSLLRSPVFAVKWKTGEGRITATCGLAGTIPTTISL